MPVQVRVLYPPPFLLAIFRILAAWKQKNSYFNPKQNSVMKSQYSSLLLFLLFPFCLQAQIYESAAKISSQNKAKRLEWLKDAGLGLRIDLGIDSQLGIVMSQSLLGASPAYQKHYFEELPSTFDPQLFHPQKIAQLAKLAGIQYLVFNVKHQSGFCLWDTETTPFNSTNTPYKKDLLKEFVAAARAHDLAVGIYYSPEDYRFLYEHDEVIRREGGEELDDEVWESYLSYIEAQCTELMSNYGKIDVLFLEGALKAEAAKTCWKLQPDILITGGVLDTPVETLPGVPIKKPWEASIAVERPSFSAESIDYKPSQQLIRKLIEARTKGGATLFTIQLQPDGSLPSLATHSLRSLAGWCFINQDAIQNVRPWIVSQEGGIHLAREKEKADVYAFLPTSPPWPLGEKRSFLLRSLSTTQASEISILGQAKNATAIQFTQEEDGLHISCVRQQQLQPDGDWPYPVVLKVTRAEPNLKPPIVQTLPPKLAPSGTSLKGFLAQKGDQAELQLGFEYRPYSPPLEQTTSTHWQKTEWVKSTASGHFKLELAELNAGEYEVRAIVKHPKVEIPGETLRFTIPSK